MRRARWSALLLVALVALAGPPAAGAADGVLSAAEPPAGATLATTPERVRLVLDVPVEAAFLRLRVRGPDGTAASGVARRDPRDARAFAADLRPAGPGAYRVAWRAFSRDGHPHGGVLAFTVGASGAPRDRSGDAPVGSDRGPLAVVARLFALVGPIGLLGLVVGRFVVVGPAWTRGGIAPPGRGGAGVDVRGDAEPGLRHGVRRWWRIWWALAATGLAGLALLPVVLLRALGEGPAALGSLLFDTRWGAAWIAQAAALGVAACVAAATVRRPVGAAPAPGLAWALALGLPPALALVAISWSGHAATGADPPLDIAIDAAHNLATAAWLGGLAALLALLPAALAGMAEPARVRLAAGVVVRFSGVAMTAVAVLVVTGVYRALVELSALSDLVETGYGRALAVKLVLFALLLCGGAYNRFRLHPRLERAALGLDPDDRGAAARLRVSVSAELALALALMAVVAVLVSLPTPA